MQATIVMLIALGGLGCQNPAEDVPPIPPAAVPTAAAAQSPAPIVGYDAAASSGYPPTLVGACDPCARDSFGDCLRDTICSFFIGRSPDVPSSREIEAAYRSGYHTR